MRAQGYATTLGGDEEGDEDSDEDSDSAEESKEGEEDDDDMHLPAKLVAAQRKFGPQSLRKRKKDFGPVVSNDPHGRKCFDRMLDNEKTFCGEVCALLPLHRTRNAASSPPRGSHRCFAPRALAVHRPPSRPPLCLSIRALSRPPQWAVFYHSYSAAALLYEVQAAIANVLFRFKSRFAVLPRLLYKPFPNFFD